METFINFDAQEGQDNIIILPSGVRHCGAWEIEGEITAILFNDDVECGSSFAIKVSELNQEKFNYELEKMRQSFKE